MIVLVHQLLSKNPKKSNNLVNQTSNYLHYKVSPVEQRELGKGHHSDQAKGQLARAIGDAVLFVFEMKVLNRVRQMEASIQRTAADENIQRHDSLVGRVYPLAEGCGHQVHAEETGELADAQHEHEECLLVGESILQQMGGDHHIHRQIDRHERQQDGTVDSVEREEVLHRADVAMHEPKKPKYGQPPEWQEQRSVGLVETEHQKADR